MKKFNHTLLTKAQKTTRKRILEISFQQHLSHIGSCLGVVDLIDVVYGLKRKKDKFVLSNGHAGVALYTILEKYKKITKDTTPTLHIHPDRNTDYDIHVSSGSLGLGFPIALGMALADKATTIYCSISDGEAAEGSVWETFRIAAERRVSNIKILVNANGWGAYGRVELKNLLKRIQAYDVKVKVVDGHNIKQLTSALKIKTKKPLVVFANTRSDQFSFLSDLEAHYYAMNETDYQKALVFLS